MNTLLFGLLALVLAWSPNAIATPQFCPGNQTIESSVPLRVGIKFAAPFVYENPKGGWRGFSVDVWETIALCLGAKTIYVEYATLEELTEAVSAKKVDVGLSTIEITSKLEQKIDFSHTYYNAFLGVLVRDAKSSRTFQDGFKKYIGYETLYFVAALIAFTILLGYAFWRSERHYSNNLFARGPAMGLFNSLIWTGQLMFSGRVDPLLVNSRALRLIVLFLTVVGATMLSGVTAMITSALTLRGIEWHIKTVADLKKQNISVMEVGRAGEWAKNENLYLTSMRSWPQVQRAFDENPNFAFVHDRAVLLFMLNEHYLKNVQVGPLSFEPAAYGIALPKGSKLREPINLSLLAIRENQVYSALSQKYFGNDL
jgi:polar amino acid transport system substrate-binding protein